MQILLWPKNLDLRIIIDLDLDPVIDLAPISLVGRAHNLINNIL
jgi:hypothetical protein